MPQLFVSYAHKDEAFTKKFIEVVQNRYKNDPAVRVWYDRNLTGGVDWWKEIMRQLGKTDIFIYLMSQTALNSEYCQAEFREAYRLRKQIITVQVDANLDIDNDQLSAIQYVDLTHGLDHADSRQELLRAIDDQLKRVPPMRLLPPRSWKQTPQPNQPNKSANAPTGTERVLRKPMDIDTRLAYIQTIIGAVALIVSIIALVFAYIEISGSPTPTPPIIGESFSAVPTPLPTTQPPPDGVLTPSPTATLSVFEQVQTAEAIQTQQMQIQQTLNAQETATELTRLNTEKTLQAIGATETVAFATLLALSATPTATPTATATHTATPDPLVIAKNGVASNADWKPYVGIEGITQRDFNGHSMVLVPAGQFVIGSTEAEVKQAVALCQQAADNNAECQRSWYEDELSTEDNTQIFDEPFWIDRYEVTRAQYEQCVASGTCETTPSSEYSTDPNQPINNVNWFQAQVYCQWRGAELPTEAQWEYASRGPDRLIFPWGNTFDGDQANHCDRLCGELFTSYNYVHQEYDDGYAGTSPVGSYPTGVSWVGTLDQAGNIWEWTSTAYGDYPYTQEDEQTNNQDISRVLRGGSFHFPAHFLRSANRLSWYPTDYYVNTGFRCALSLNNPVS